MSEREQPMTQNRRRAHIEALRQRVSMLGESIRAEMGTREDSAPLPGRAERRALLWAITELEKAEGGE